MCQGFFSSPSGISEEEHAFKVAIHDLNQKNLALLEVNKQLENHIKSFEDEILKNDSIIHNSTTEQLDSMYTDYFRRR
jgi:hypothetical protein|tara:strand:- start:3473 stop:3706 length:234 start_codon:yes stop_codon:yes gene_type:complete